MIVTGANRGLGKEICQKAINSIRGPLVLYAANRAGGDVEFENVTRNVTLKFPKVDITKPSDIQSLARIVEKEHGKVDVLFNNAGILLADSPKENIKKTLDTNFRGTLRMCEEFIPLLKKDGRIVNITSTASTLGRFHDRIREQMGNPELSPEDKDRMIAHFQSTIDDGSADRGQVTTKLHDPDLSLDEVESMMADYLNCVEDGSAGRQGWPEGCYGTSKACINAITTILARDNPGLIINACCPGWFLTDMGLFLGPCPPKSAANAAAIPFRLGFHDIGGITGSYWANPSISSNDDGQVMKW
ncbi:hypothetical protein MMC09_004513 [Bachmanniomyces sp. S44760]|nr:hypothetical protein [Bachmanniomyces sp. S44760]